MHAPWCIEEWVIQPPRPVRVTHMSPHSLIQDQSIAKHPGGKCGMVHAETTFGHQVFQIAVTERIAQISPHTQHDDRIFEVPPRTAVPCFSAFAYRSNLTATIATLPTHEHSDKMIARSFDCPTTTGKRNCKLVQLGKAFRCIGNCDAGQCGPIGVQSRYRVAARMWVNTESDHKRISLKEGVRPRDACLSRSRYKAPWYPAITPAHPRMWRAVQFTLKPPFGRQCPSNHSPHSCYTDNALVVVGVLVGPAALFSRQSIQLSDAGPESCFPRMALLQTCQEHGMLLKGCILRDPVLQAFAG